VHDVDSYQVCQYELHEFDMSGRGPVADNQRQTTHSQLVDMPHFEVAEKHPLVYEMFQTFCGLYKMEDCARILAENNNDLELVTVQLLSDQDKTSHESNDKMINLTRTTTLCETEIKLIDGSKPVEMEGSIMYQNCIQNGRWTINNE